MIQPPEAPRRASPPDDLFLKFAALAPGEYARFARDFGTLRGRAEDPGDWDEAVGALRLGVEEWLELRREQGASVAAELETVFARRPPVDEKDTLLYLLGVKAFNRPEEVTTRFNYLHHILMNQLTPDRVACSIEADYARLTFSVLPMDRNLIGKMWLQFANAIEGQWEVRLCAHCRKPFHAADKRAQYCGPACRVSASRARGRQQ